MTKPAAPPPTKSFDFKLIEYEPGHHPRFAAICLLPYGNWIATGDTEQQAINALKDYLDRSPYKNGTIINVSW